jgi:hypothetical protein
MAGSFTLSAFLLYGFCLGTKQEYVEKRNNNIRKYEQITSFNNLSEYVFK